MGSEHLIYIPLGRQNKLPDNMQMRKSIYPDFSLFYQSTLSLVRSFLYERGVISCVPFPLYQKSLDVTITIQTESGLVSVKYSTSMQELHFGGG